MPTCRAKCCLHRVQQSAEWVCRAVSNLGRCQVGLQKAVNCAHRGTTLKEESSQLEFRSIPERGPWISEKAIYTILLPKYATVSFHTTPIFLNSTFIRRW